MSERSFKEKVFDCIRNIPEGKISTYKLVAEEIGHPKSYRAVGTALSQNPKPYSLKNSFMKNKIECVPCHRVIKSDYSIGGFVGETKGENVDIKMELLEKEGIEFSSSKPGFLKEGKKYRESVTYEF